MKVITFSRTFPAYHPKCGQPTFFVDKIYAGIGVNGDYIHIPIPDVDNFLYNNDEDFFEAKWHTIRYGNRWKVGDKFSPRVWSGKPYSSKQITIAPDIEVKKTWQFIIDNDCLKINGLFHSHANDFSAIKSFAQNDGLAPQDLLDWFEYPKKVMKDSQIICWNESINY